MAIRELGCGGTRGDAGCLGLTVDDLGDGSHHAAALDLAVADLRDGCHHHGVEAALDLAVDDHGDGGHGHDVGLATGFMVLVGGGLVLSGFEEGENVTYSDFWVTA